MLRLNPKKTLALLLTLAFICIAVLLNYTYQTGYSFEFPAQSTYRVSVSGCGFDGLFDCDYENVDEIDLPLNAIKNLEKVKFCGEGATTPELWVRFYLEQDMSFGIVKIQRFGIQHPDKGLMFPCYFTQHYMDKFVEEVIRRHSIEDSVSNK